MAPAVFAAYKRPPAAATSASAGEQARSSTGKVPPMRNAGTPTSTKGKAHASRPASASMCTNQGAACASAQVAPRASTATPSSRAA
jgi:hypothetical protein